MFRIRLLHHSGCPAWLLRLGLLLSLWSPSILRYVFNFTCFLFFWSFPPFFFAFFSFLLSALFVVSSSSTTLLCCCFKFVNSWRSVCVCAVRGSCEIVEVFYFVSGKRNSMVFLESCCTLYGFLEAHCPLSRFIIWCSIFGSNAASALSCYPRESHIQTERQRDTHTHRQRNRLLVSLKTWRISSRA